MTLIPIGMVGVGNFGRWRRMRLRESGQFRLVACCDLDATALADACREEQCEAVENFDALLANPEIVGIVISTGADSHAALTIRAARAGKHVFVEKPLCCSMEEMHALLAVEMETGVAIGMGHVHPSTPTDQVVKQALVDGRLGTVTAIELNTSHGGGWLPSAWRFNPEKNPGGMLFHCGIHHIFWLQSLFGLVTDVTCMMRYDVNPNTKTADATTVLMRMASGILVTQQAYHVTAYEHAKRIYGTNGTLYTSEFPDAVYYQARRTDGGEEARVRLDLSQAPDADVSGLANVMHWARAIRGEGRPDPSLLDGARAMAVIFAAVESAQTDRVVPVHPLSTTPYGGNKATLC